MLCFILFSFHNFRACITQCVCVCVSVECVMFIHWKANTVIRFKYMFDVVVQLSFSICTVLFPFTLHSSATIAAAAFMEASGTFGFLLTTSIYTTYIQTYTRERLQYIRVYLCCVHTQHTGTQIHHIFGWNLFYRVAECQLSKSSLRIPYDFNGLRLFWWRD